MNAKQRKKDRKLKELIRLGMEARAVIGAAEGEKTAALTLAERIRSEKLTAEQAVQEALGEIEALQGKLVEMGAAHAAKLRELRDANADAIVDLDQRHAKNVEDLKARHLAAIAEHKHRIGTLEARLAGIADIEKLRKRLQAKEAEIVELQAERDRLRALVPKDPGALGMIAATMGAAAGAMTVSREALRRTDPQVVLVEPGDER